MTLLALATILALAAPAPERPTITPYTRPAQPPTITPLLGSQGSIQIILPGALEAPPLSQRIPEPLTMAQQLRLRTARQLRESGQLAAARDTLQRLLLVAPHQPLVLNELAKVLGAMSNWTGVELLARAERAAQRDTLLLGRELAMALERLKRPREAAVVVLENWRLRPGDSDWAVESLTRLANNDSKGVRDAVRRAATAHPERVDFLTAAAGLDWKMGDGPQALKGLAASDSPGITPPLRWRFADALLATGATRDSVGAVDALISMIADPRYDPSYRMLAARRAMEVHRARGTARAGAPAIYAALKDIVPARWNAELLVDVARGLREAGQTAAARALLDSPVAQGNPQRPNVTLERAMDDLHEGPPSNAIARLHDIAATSQEARFRFAEALFFSGLADSALAEYKRVTEDTGGAFTGAAFDRTYLIEDASPKSFLPMVGRLMYFDWRGDARAALMLADTLYRATPHNALWARIAIFRGQRLDAAGQPDSALVPLLELATQLPDDRLAPLAREMAGDVYQFKLKREPEAIAQYEECLTRYPRAWNSAEVRRRLESLRKRRL